MNWKKGFVRVVLSVLPWTAALAQSTELVSINSSGVQGNRESVVPRISPDARFVVFFSPSWNLDPAYPGGGVFLRDRALGTTVLASVNTAGEAPDLFGTYELSYVSGDGRFVVFSNWAGNFGVPNPGHLIHAYVRDMQTGTTSSVDVDPSGHSGDWGAVGTSISADGRYVVFSSNSDSLVPGDTNGVDDVFRYDLQTGSMACASVDAGGTFGNAGSGDGVVSADGRWVAFGSPATNLVASDTNGQMDVFVHDFQTGSTTRVSLSSSGGEANGGSGWSNSDTFMSISSDGNRVAYMSWATNLVPGDTNGAGDVFVHDVTTGRTERVNLDSSGAQSFYTYGYALSGNGRFVAFTSDSTVLVPGDTNASYDVFLRDLQTGVTTRESVNGRGNQANSTSTDPAISFDGRFVAFASAGTQLVSGDVNGQVDVFLHDRAPAAATAFCAGDGSGAACPCANSGGPFRGCENSASTGGSVLAAVGLPSLVTDTLHLTSFGEKPSALSVFVQGTLSIAPANYGDGLRCVGGTLKRLYSRNASLGVVRAPQGAESPISIRSAALGDAITAGTTRSYQVQYRDPVAGFCASPSGDLWNVSSALSVVWDP